MGGRNRVRRIDAPSIADSACAEARWNASEALGAGNPPVQRASDAAEKTRRFVLRVIQRSPMHGRHACQAGCAFCCHTAVTVAPPEAIAIARYLSEHVDEAGRAGLFTSLESNAAIASTTSRVEYTGRNIRCALLSDDNRCMVHPVRPLACASFLSASRSACEAEFNRVSGRGPVPVDQYAHLVGLSASYGLKEACQKSDLDGEFYELHHALRRIWDMPDAADRWVQGDKLFDGCLKATEW